MRLKFDEKIDKFIKEKIFIKRHITGNIALNTNYKKLLKSDIIEYLNNCFDDSFSIKETLYRIYYNINDHPKCEICKTNYSQFDNTKKGLFKTYCDNKKCINTIIFLHGKETKKEKYGNENFNNREKYKTSYNLKSESEKKNIISKVKKSKLEKYGNENYVNSDKARKTKLERYNDETFCNPKKGKQTKLERYGDPYYRNIEKMKKTKLERYGSESYVNPELGKKTKLERYGDENYNNTEKIQKTCLEKFGYNTIFKVPEVAKKISNSSIRKQHEYETKKRNHSHNQSKSEEETYILLKDIYPDVLRQYKSELYPFACDFYIPSKDLYIECNYHWTHGEKLYENSENDNLIIQEWKNRNTKFYDNAINTWTNLDVRKYKIAKENKLNYLIFYNINDFKEWIKNL